MTKTKPAAAAPAADLPTTDVHEALRRAVDAERNGVRLLNANFKIHPAKKEIAEQICAHHGTTFSAFLRACADGLIGDYAGPKAAQFLKDNPA